jgi:hypothetical protein
MSSGALTRRFLRELVPEANLATAEVLPMASAPNAAATGNQRSVS